VTARVGVLVHGADEALGEALVGAVATGAGLGEVRAIEAVPRDVPVAPAAARLREVAGVVVGLGAWPFPGLAARHDASRDALGDVPYWAVETWHGLPAFHDALAAALGGVRAGARPVGARVLLTAPDVVIRTLPPEHRVVLRDVAEALQARTGTRPTIAVDRSPASGAVTPTAVDALTSLVEAHGATTVVRCSLVPGDGPDEAVTSTASSLGIGLDDVAIDAAAHVAVLLEVVGTVLRQAVGGAATGRADADGIAGSGAAAPSGGTDDPSAERA
jgi:hypothetical protein